MGRSIRNRSNHSALGSIALAAPIRNGPCNLPTQPALTPEPTLANLAADPPNHRRVGHCAPSLEQEPSVSCTSRDRVRSLIRLVSAAPFVLAAGTAQAQQATSTQATPQTQGPARAPARPPVPNRLNQTLPSW